MALTLCELALVCDDDIDSNVAILLTTRIPPKTTHLYCVLPTQGACSPFGMPAAPLFPPVRDGALADAVRVAQAAALRFIISNMCIAI